MLELDEFSEVAKVLISVLSAVATVFPFGISFRATVGERWLFAAFAGGLTFLLLPDTFTQCSGIAKYRWWALISLVLAAAFAAGYVLVHKRHSYSQTAFNGDARTLNTIVGGGPLTSEAGAVLVKHPELNLQQILDRLDGDPDRVWPRRTRSYFALLHRAMAFGTGLAVVALLTCVIVAALIARRTEKSHVALSLAPSTDQTVRQPGVSIAIVPTFWECNRQIEWTIDGPDDVVGRRDIVGQITPTGNYFAPPTITRNVDFYVVATPLEHRYERQQVKIQLRTHPDYSTPFYADVPDNSNKRASLVIEVLDKRYSWHIGENWLDGPEGSTLIAKMAKDGLFTGVQQIIAVGAASREYTVLNGDENAAKRREDSRALGRAQVLGTWIHEAIEPARTPIWALKVGRYDAEGRLTPGETAPERQVVIVGVIKTERDVDMVSAIRNAFEAKRFDEPVLGRYLDKYPHANWEIVPVDPGN